MNDKIVRLNFDSAAHDTKVEAAELTEAQRRLIPRQRLVKRQMHSTYQRWTAKVRGKNRTRKDILAATYELQTLMGTFAKAANECGLEEWHQFTMQIIEDKIATIISTDITEKNEITPYIPDGVTMLDKDNDAIVAKDLREKARPTTFRTMEELFDIPFVANARTKTGFVGFCLYGNGLVAVYKDGDAVGIGLLANGKGVEKFPTVEEFSKALEAGLSAPHPGPPSADGGTTPGASDTAGGSAPTSPDPTGPTGPTGGA